MRDPFRNLSIKRKLTLIITLTSGLAVMLACAGFVLQEMTSFRSVTLESTRTIAKFVGQNAAPAIGADDAVAAKEVLDSLDGQPHIIAAVLYNSAGRAFARYIRPGAEPDLPGIAPSAEFEPKFYPDRLELAQPVHGPNGKVLGMLYLVSDLKALDERIRRYFTIAAGLLLLSMIAASILSAAFQRIITAPLSELVNLARRVSTQKNYSLRATPRGHDEIGVAIEGFNDMLEQIQRRDGALRGAHDDLEERVNERTHQLREQIGERVAAEKALQQQFARISLLNQITTAISNRQDLESIVQIVLAEIEAHLPADFASL